MTPVWFPAEVDQSKLARWCGEEEKEHEQANKTLSTKRVFVVVVVVGFFSKRKKEEKTGTLKSKKKICRLIS